MAIIFDKEPEGIYPGFNDSYLFFHSSNSNVDRCEMDIAGDIYAIYPDTNGRFVFNLKPHIKRNLVSDGFRIEDSAGDSLYDTVSSGMYYTLLVGITIFYGNDQTENVVNTYRFFKSVVQKGEYRNTNQFGLASYTENEYDYRVPYFGGYPMFIQIKRTLESSPGNLVFINKLTKIRTQEFPLISGKSIRVYLDRGNGTNWNSENFIPLIYGLNRIEMEIRLELAANITIKKHRKKCGVFMRWFNSNGSASYWLWDRFYNTDLRGSEIDVLKNNEPFNVGDDLPEDYSYGRDTDDVITVKSKFDEHDIKYVRDLYISPYVEVYTSEEPDIPGKFLRVYISGNYSFSSKKKLNELSLRIEKSKPITMTY